MTFSLRLFNICCAQNIYTFAGSYWPGYSGDGGPAILAKFYSPNGIAIDTSGNKYIVDANNHRIRKINNSGIITTIAGTGVAGYSGDGGIATSALINLPSKIAVDDSGNVYFSEYNGNRVRKINKTGIISTLAGNGIAGYNGSGWFANALQLNSPVGIAIDTAHNIFIADQLNARIRKVVNTGLMFTIAGTGTAGYSGDGGPAISAQINAPTGVATDISGNVYFCDYQSHCIRKINTSGIINTVAGTGFAGYSGDAGPAIAAKMFQPNGITLDTLGNIYFSDQGNNVIRKINTFGVISTIAGNGGSGYSGDGGFATLATLNTPKGIALDASGNIYFCDYGNDIVRVICPSACLAGINKIEQISNSINIYPNPSKNILNISIGKNNFENSQIEIINYIGRTVLSMPFVKEIDVSKLSSGIYNLKITTTHQYLYFSKFVKE